MNKQKAKRKKRKLGAVGIIFAGGKKERMNQRSVGGLLRLSERPRAARENKKRNEKATWAPVERM